ncbi:GAR transformylase 2 [Prochlorococcus marinus str. MIT 9515]|uniref:Formate-dependent phosphoribosylglycinamide formyltransferase n=1 Tax=Prochlorococcus marinus (strain MIT 9515) TaxID=167542 RepID=PURT_PROM5|nr:formate-dependent phosphoribosylglycinamide formyltransferase [Prochlorococcus marinus]A2BWY5.1 RecName: Full=Formate-dependent phosphoribosylglycinamide formyltransferase; AltName: Full=5'-phosphoribosylglycinamide transformylase 2; AltName: Full=Formate-dependent GAR transformylase; AltName: Full=GAR transformylase 2; Short=GART 2; AltName: Full=Non-folate glycinamide ribonucleotide transformylase; AltName: Full=Phosphoribosylglycinamide formyltransferase 2 [Prochlorococcus marinus str. MIT 9
MDSFKFIQKKILLLGSGELGKELVVEAKRLGLEVIAIDKYENAPAMQLADHSFVINMNDKKTLINTIKKIEPDFVVPEIEALSIEALKELEEEGINIVPNARTVEITMNRHKIRDLASKELNIKTANFSYVFNAEELEMKSSEIGFPLLLKPLMSSSGKGQSLVKRKEDLLLAWEDALKNSRGKIEGVILEEFLNFDYEFTLLTVRKSSGENVFCEPIGHEQYKGDYQCSWQPLDMNESLINEARNMTNKILNNLNGSGIYGVEFFVRGKEVIFSELSPRPHDTGMVTLVSQNLNEFELHLRAFLNLPIPKISLLKPSATRVILSEKESINPSYTGLNEALEVENTKVLIFGKPTSKKGRRMGVVLSSDDDLNIARKNADKSASKIKIVS